MWLWIAAVKVFASVIADTYAGSCECHTMGGQYGQRQRAASVRTERVSANQQAVLVREVNERVGPSEAELALRG